MPIDDRDYVAAWRSGGSRSVEALLNSRCPTADARIRELELLECLGNWEILWRRNATSRKLAGGKTNPISAIGKLAVRERATQPRPAGKAAIRLSDFRPRPVRRSAVSPRLVGEIVLRPVTAVLRSVGTSPRLNHRRPYCSPKRANTKYLPAPGSRLPEPRSLRQLASGTIELASTRA